MYKTPNVLSNDGYNHKHITKKTEAHDTDTSDKMVCD